jgi:hypothetical protein
VISFDYAAFEDYWASFSTGPSRIAQQLSALPAEQRAEIERNVRAGYLAGMTDGPRSFAIIVRAVRGIVPQWPVVQGLTNFSTNSSFGCGGSGVFLSLGSLGLRRNFPSSTSLKPAASTSWRRKASSIRCRVPDSDMPVPGRPA